VDGNNESNLRASRHGTDTTVYYLKVTPLSVKGFPYSTGGEAYLHIARLLGSIN